MNERRLLADKKSAGMVVQGTITPTPVLFDWP
jgi:hypothetical protein